MKQGVSRFRIFGMEQDSNPAILGNNPQEGVHTHAFENMNMRVNALNEKELGALTNEKGTLPIRWGKEGAFNSQIKGIPIGQSVLNNSLVVFTTDGTEETAIEDSDQQTAIINTESNTELGISNIDRIYKFDIDSASDTLDSGSTVRRSFLLYEGNLNFDYTNPIDTISFYENELIQKVYWIDDANQPRFINIAQTYRYNEYDKEFDFIRELQLKEKVFITKNNDASGIFDAGTIQYCMTYFDKYGQESNIFYISPIYYITFNDRGTPVNESVGNSFSIQIRNLDTTFDYVRIYSIHRSAKNATPECKIVSEVSIDTKTFMYNTYIPNGSFFEAGNTNRVVFHVHNDDNTNSRPRESFHTLTDLIQANTEEWLVDGMYNSLTQVYTFTFNVRYGNEATILDKIRIERDSDTADETAFYPPNNSIVVIKYDERTHRIYIYCCSETHIDEQTGNLAFTTTDDDIRCDIAGHPALNITDTGTTGSIVDRYAILYAGGEPIIAKTFEHKDNTLFFGNVKITRNDIYKLLLGMHAGNNMSFHSFFTNCIKEHPEAFEYKNTEKKIQPWNTETYYNHVFQLNTNEYDIKTFKSREWYRFGLQFQNIYGVWSEPLWIGDKYNDKHIDCAYVDPSKEVGLITAELDFDTLIDSEEPDDGIDSIYEKIKDYGFVKVRPVAVYPEPYERECLCQGYLNPTVYNYGDRTRGHCYAQSSWFARPVITYPKKFKIDKLGGNFTTWDYIQEDNQIPGYTSNVEEQSFTAGYSGRPLEYRHLYPIPTSMSFSSEIQSVFNYKDFTLKEADDTLITKEEFLSKYAGYFGVDQSIVTLHTPDVEDLYNLELDKCKLRIVGMIPMTSFVGNIDIATETAGLSYCDIGKVDEDDNKLKSKVHKFLKPHVFNPKVTIKGLSWHGANIMGAGAYYSSKIYGENAKNQTDHIGWYFEMTENENMSSLERPNVGYLQKKQNEDHLKLESLSHNPLFVIYPWHRDTSLINQNYGDVLFSKPNTKRLSNLRYSYNTFYFDTDWKPQNQLSDCQLIDSEETVFTQLKVTGKNNTEEKVLYKPNVDYIVATSSSQEYSIKLVMPEYLTYNPDLNQENIVPIVNESGYVASTTYSGAWMGTLLGITVEMLTFGMPVGLSLAGTAVGAWFGYLNGTTSDYNTHYDYGYFTEEEMYSRYFTKISDVIPSNKGDNNQNVAKINKYVDKHKYSSDPIHMKYKSSPHVVLSLKGEVSNGKTTQEILPFLHTGYDNLPSGNNYNHINKEKLKLKANYDYYGYSEWVNYDLVNTPVWDDTITRIHQEQVELFDLVSGTSRMHPCITNNRIDGKPDITQNALYGFLWLGELYRDNVENRFGGNTESALENNKWVICGNPVEIKRGMKVKWIGGDTYYQRYDNLKTYPFTLEDTNSITDIVSFMCETRHNIEGRTDRNRGLADNTLITPKIFNLFNDAYTQDNNFFPINYRDSNKLWFDKFENTITWTGTKTAGSLIDNWTRLPLASSLDFNGDLGPVNLIEKNNNVLYVFQDNGISILNYNNNVALSTVQGTPIELANSGKVEGKEYVSETIGCKNKWAAVSTERGIYFIDDLNKDIYIVGRKELLNLSEIGKMSSYINKTLEGTGKWNPVDFNNYVVYYDYNNHDVMFINKDKSLAYNEVLNSFTSFYNYGKAPYFSNVAGRGIWINKPFVNVQSSNNETEDYYTLWYHNEGEYNRFFNKGYRFYTEFVANDIPDYNKIFDTVEYVADGYNNNEYVPNYSYNTLETKDTYQEGKVKLVFANDVPSTLKKKFRTWRVPIPRAINEGVITRDRMQDHWLFLKLIGNQGLKDTEKLSLYNVNVFYYQ